MGILLAERGHFQVLIAENEEEVKMAQKLRYDIFFRGRAGEDIRPEIGSEELDVDQFDPQFRHILVVDTTTGAVAGTYRFQSGLDAGRGLGFYSGVEYQLNGVDFTADFFEVGRSCVAENFRGGTVISLLWQGLSGLQQRENYRHLFGCVSFPVSQLAAAWHLYDQQAEAGALDDVIKAEPRPGYRVDRPALTGDAAELTLPPLMKGYLRLGAKIAGPPVLDAQFGSVDLLIHLNFFRMTGRYSHHYGGDQKEAAE